MLVKVAQLILLADFIVLDYEIDDEIPIVLDRPFLEFGRALVDMECGNMKFWIHDDEVFFRVYKTKKTPMGLQVLSVSEIMDKKVDLKSPTPRIQPDYR